MSHPVLKICGRLIGYDYDPLVIAEIGINHGGSLAVAKDMVDAAVNAGAEIIKHQTHIIEDEMSRHADSVIPGNSGKSIYQIMKECALNEEDEYELMRYVVSKGKIFISTPFSRAAVDRLARFDVPAFKIGSGECNNYPLVEYIAAMRKPVILSTGMNTVESVRKSAAILRKHSVPYALLHCTNLYPTPPGLVRLDALLELKKEFSDAVIGLSDHTADNYACLGAAALGASILERHFTDSMSREGPDIACSMDPKALKELLEGSRILKQERGGGKDLLPDEQVTRDFAFASVVTIKNIKKGDVFTKDNLWVKRPGNGEIQAEQYNSVLGKRANKDIEPDEQLRWIDIE